MLKEIEHVRQNKGEPFRRIFNGNDLSLILWYEEGAVVAYQLNYQKDGEDLSFTWDKAKGSSHKIIDDGEGRPFRHKMSQVLSSPKTLNKEYLHNLLRAESIDCELNELSFVIEHLSQ